MGYYIANDGVQSGPFEVADLINHGLKKDSLIWTEGMADWKPAGDVSELAGLLTAQALPSAATPSAVKTPSDWPERPASVVSPSIPPPSPSERRAAPTVGYKAQFPSPTNGMAVASMVLGIVSFPMSILYCTGFIAALLAIIFGFKARGKVMRGETKQGKGMATAGIVLGFAHFLLVGILVAIFMAIAGYSARAH